MRQNSDRKAGRGPIVAQEIPPLRHVVHRPMRHVEEEEAHAVREDRQAVNVLSVKEQGEDEGGEKGENGGDIHNPGVKVVLPCVLKFKSSDKSGQGFALVLTPGQNRF